jgi:hypothetical protein
MRAVDAASDLLKPYDARLMRCLSRVRTHINSVAHDDAACTAPVQLGTRTDDDLKWEPAKLPGVLAQREIQRPAMLGIRLEEPTRSGNRFPEVSAPNWR